MNTENELVATDAECDYHNNPEFVQQTKKVLKARKQVKGKE